MQGVGARDREGNCELHETGESDQGRQWGVDEGERDDAVWVESSERAAVKVYAAGDDICQLDLTSSGIDQGHWCCVAAEGETEHVSATLWTVHGEEFQGEVLRVCHVSFCFGAVAGACRH